MILHLFFQETGEYIRSGEYNKDRLPTGVLTFDGNLPVCNVPDKLVFLDGKVVVMNPVQWTKYRILMGEITLSEHQKIDADGKIVSKSQSEILEEGSPENAFRYMYDLISTEAANRITAGYSSLALGTPHTYDTSLEDQFNFKSIKDMGIDAPLRCLDEVTKVKTFVKHTKEQIKDVHDGFAFNKNNILMKADSDKTKLRALFESGASTKEILGFLNG